MMSVEYTLAGREKSNEIGPKDKDNIKDLVIP
jgi:hypothetical protein